MALSEATIDGSQPPPGSDYMIRHDRPCVTRATIDKQYLMDMEAPLATLKIGIIGCGNISGIYCENLARYSGVQLLACSDLDMDRARALRERYGFPMALSVDELLSRPDIDLVINLTVPKAHSAISANAVQSGKHVYSEKPLAVDVNAAAAVLQQARDRELRIGCAPDTFLGGSHQTCRRLIDRGDIGEPVGATAFMLCHGHESWHPNPAFYYEAGGGPMMDMGPYYLTALVNLLGPIKRVTGISRATFPSRTITSNPLAGQRIAVETPTHICSVLDFQSGAIASVVMSFDVWHTTLPRIEVYGSEGTLLVPDPNGFGGEVRIRSIRDSEWRVVAPIADFLGNARGLGVAEMAEAIQANRPHRASGQLAGHVLDAMAGADISSETGMHHAITCTADRPAPLPPTYRIGSDGTWLLTEEM